MLAENIVPKIINVGTKYSKNFGVNFHASRKYYTANISLYVRRKHKTNKSLC